jgi:tellurite resistance protein
MSTLTSLKLVAAKRPGSLPQIVQRRNRLISKIWEQTELAKAQQAGTAFRPTLFRSVKDAETGERRNVEVQKRVRAWWWTAENGKVCMHVRYGTKTLELAKGKTAIEIGTLDDLIPTLETLKAAVAAGELDGQIEAVSGQMRSGFIGK